MKARLLIALRVALCSCHRDEPRSACGNFNAAAAHVQLAMSMQMLRIEVSRDEVEEVGKSAANKCNPQLSIPVYDSVDADLLSLAACTSDEADQSNLKEITAEWKLLRERHIARWRQSQDYSPLDPKESCMRASDVSGSRLAIERNWEKLQARARQ